MYSRLSRLSAARGSCIGAMTVGPTVLRWWCFAVLNYNCILLVVLPLTLETNMNNGTTEQRYNGTQQSTRKIPTQDTHNNLIKNTLAFKVSISHVSS